MAEPVYPSLEKEGQAGQIGFEGLAAGGQHDQGGSFSVQFTPSSGDSNQQLTDEQQPSYRTFEGGEQPTQASSEEIGLLEKHRPTTPTAEEKVLHTS